MGSETGFLASLGNHQKQDDGLWHPMNQNELVRSTRDRSCDRIRAKLSRGKKAKGIKDEK